MAKIFLVKQVAHLSHQSLSSDEKVKLKQSCKFVNTAFKLEETMFH